MSIEVVILMLGLAASPKLGAALPAFSLADPRGAQVTQALASGRSVVVVVTTPTLEQADAQNGWNKDLSGLSWSADSGPLYLWIEDMSQSWFKDTALKEMRAQYHPPPLMLLDHDGAVRRALGVADATSVVLVFDAQGKLALVETAAPTPERGRAIWARARSLMPSASPSPSPAPSLSPGPTPSLSAGAAP